MRTAQLGPWAYLLPSEISGANIGLSGCWDGGVTEPMPDTVQKVSVFRSLSLDEVGGLSLNRRNLLFFTFDQFRKIKVKNDRHKYIIQIHNS